MSKVGFSELPPKYQKGKKRSILDMDDDELEEWGENKAYKRDYDKQFKENMNYFPQQYKALNQEISPEDWDKLDNPQGPISNYEHPLDLQSGSEIEANLNAFSNRGNEITETKKKTKLGIWGGVTRKNRKGKKSRKGRKGRKSKKNRKSRK